MVHEYHPGIVLLTNTYLELRQDVDALELLHIVPVEIQSTFSGHGPFDCSVWKPFVGKRAHAFAISSPGCISLIEACQLFRRRYDLSQFLYKCIKMLLHEGQFFVHAFHVSKCGVCGAGLARVRKHCRILTVRRGARWNGC